MASSDSYANLFRGSVSRYGYPAPRQNSQIHIQTQAQAQTHSFVPVVSLTSSPTSTTGSASVLDWNSNSDGDFLRHSPRIDTPQQQEQQPQQEGPTSPTTGYDFASLSSSPSSLGLTNVHDDDAAQNQDADSRRGTITTTVTALNDGPFGDVQWEITPVHTSPTPSVEVFGGSIPPAPVGDDVVGVTDIAAAAAAPNSMADTETRSSVVLDEEREEVPSSDEYQGWHTPPSAVAERLSLQDMVLEWNASVEQEEGESVDAREVMSPSTVTNTNATTESIDEASTSPTTVVPSPPKHASVALFPRPSFRSLFGAPDDLDEQEVTPTPRPASAAHSELSYTSEPIPQASSPVAPADDGGEDGYRSTSSESVIIDISHQPLPSCFLKRSAYTGRSMDFPVGMDSPIEASTIRPETRMSGSSIEDRSETTISGCGSRSTSRDSNRSRTQSVEHFLASPPDSPPAMDASMSLFTPPPTTTSKRPFSRLPAPATSSEGISSDDGNIRPQSSSFPGDESLDTPAPSWLPPTVSTSSLPSLAAAADASTFKPAAISSASEMPNLPSWLRPTNANSFSRPRVPATTASTRTSTIESSSTIADAAPDVGHTPNSKTTLGPTPRKRPPLPPLPKAKTPDLSLLPKGFQPFPNGINPYALGATTAWDRSGRSTPFQITIESPAFPNGASSAAPVLSGPTAKRFVDVARLSNVSNVCEMTLPPLRTPTSPFIPEVSISQPLTPRIGSHPPIVPSYVPSSASVSHNAYQRLAAIPPVQSPIWPPPTPPTARPLPNPAEDLFDHFELFDSPRSRESSPSPSLPASSPIEDTDPPRRIRIRSVPTYSIGAPIPQRRLRFAPLPPTPGSSLRASAFSPYISTPYQHQQQQPPPVPPNGSAPGYTTMPYLYPYQAPIPRPPVPPMPVPPTQSWYSPPVTQLPPVSGRPWYTRNMVDTWDRLNMEARETTPASRPMFGSSPGMRLSDSQDMEMERESSRLPPLARQTRPTPHSVFWFSDGTVVFRVEDCLFKVHRYFFERHAEHFRILLGTRPTVIGPTQGSQPFVLLDTKKADFEKLLYVFYPSNLTSPDLSTVSDWTSVLSLAHKWNMSELKALAIQKLAPLASSVEKISLAKKYDMGVSHEWLLPAYTELCSRSAPLALAEAEQLDMQTVVKIWEVQHEITNWPGMYYHPAVEQLVREKFGLL